MGAAAAARPRERRGTAPPRQRSLLIGRAEQRKAAPPAPFVRARLCERIAAFSPWAACSPPQRPPRRRPERRSRTAPKCSSSATRGRRPSTAIGRVVVAPAPSRAALTLLRADTRGSRKSRNRRSASRRRELRCRRRSAATGNRSARRAAGARRGRARARRRSRVPRARRCGPQSRCARRRQRRARRHGRRRRPRDGRARGNGRRLRSLRGLRANSRDRHGRRRLRAAGASATGSSGQYADPFDTTDR